MNSRGHIIVAILAAGVLAAGAAPFFAADKEPVPGGSTPVAEPNPPAKAAEADQRDADRAAIRKSVESFIKAFESGDAKAVAAHWTEDGEYVSDDGTSFRGRSAIEKAYQGLFADKPKFSVECDMTSLRFPSAATAIEEGYFRVRRGTDEPGGSKYSVLHVKENGKWLMAVVREWPSEGHSLRDLEWLIGTWETKKDGIEVHTEYTWWGNKSFIRGQYTIKTKEHTYTGFQMIGKDFSTGSVRSWTFEDDGGFAEAVWEREGRKWTLDSAGVSNDGSVLSATNIMTKLDHDNYTWQSVDRTLAGESMRDLPPVKVTRVKKR